MKTIWDEINDALVPAPGPFVYSLSTPLPPVKWDPPKFFNPSVGRRQRMYTSRAAASQYENGWLNPHEHAPDACGRPAQQGSLDRLMHERDQEREHAE